MYCTQKKEVNACMTLCKFLIRKLHKNISSQLTFVKIYNIHIFAIQFNIRLIMFVHFSKLVFQIVFILILKLYLFKSKY